MKRLFLALTLAAFGGMPLAAQEDHHGPVVYPTNSAPDTEPAPAPTTDMTVQRNASVPTRKVAPQFAPGSSSISAPVIPMGSAPGAPQNPGSAVSPVGGSSPPDDIYDIRPPFFYLKPLTWLWVLLGTIALVALAVGLWFLLAPLRAMRAKSTYELTLEKLEKARALLNEQDPEPYAVFVSETIRSYLGQRFRAPSTRRTTEEFLHQMQADPNTPLAAHRDLLRGFLEACDLVKFAHYQPGRDELEQVQQRAVSFVTATRPMEGVTA